jgi:uncharacterized protein YigE (DUF2233 family)
MTARRLIAALAKTLAKTLAMTLAMTLASPVVAAAGCTPQLFDDNAYTVCRFDPATQPLELYNLQSDGEPIGSYSTLARLLAGEGKALTFAMNAGMFDEKLRPVGLYVEDGEQRKKLNRRSGYGNFHLTPNGVFWIDGKKAGVSESDAYVKSGRRPDFATQSGPMLVINGKLHPKFSERGTSAKIRNGVGVTAKGEVVFAISDGFVTFHQFATLFRDHLETPNALFLDGSISSLYSTDLGRNDSFRPLGPMVGAWEMQ